MNARALVLPALGLLCATLAGSAPAPAQLWAPFPDGASSPSHPGAGRETVLALDTAAMRIALAQAPAEGAGVRESELPSIALPLPEGGSARYRIRESSIMEPALQARFPEIRSYLLTGEGSVGRATLTPAGLDAIVVAGGRILRVVPLPAMRVASGGGAPHVAYVEAATPGEAALACGAEEASLPAGGARPLLASGTTLYTYRLAVATTGEYYAARGGTDASVLASIVTVIDKVNLFYGMELGIRFTLVGAMTNVFYTNPATDPYTDGTPCTMRLEAQADILSVVGDANFDVGHVFGAVPAGGCAGGSNPCTAAKATGASTLQTDSLHPPDHEDFGGYRLVMHELGHQFGAGHSWNAATGGNCTPGQYSAASAVEPDSGTTLMSYVGVCGAGNLGPGPADPYFHAFSHDQIITFVTVNGGDACAVTAPSGNAAPVVDAGPDYTIPRGTPFTLSGSASDADGDVLTFTWEQVDPGVAQLPPSFDDGIGPLFRSFPPSAEGDVRTFPQWSDVLGGSVTMGETLPTTDRTMTFALTARDDRPVGGVDSDQMTVTTSGAPFTVTAPGSFATFEAGCDVTVAWSAGSAGSHATEARVLFSADGGATFDTVLAQVPIAGPSAVVTLPCVATTQGRIKVEAVGNIFFDVNPGNFEVVAAPADIALTAEGGDVDDECKRLVAFEATLTDGCGIAAGQVAVSAELTGGFATVGTPSFVAQQIDPATVEVTGTVLVSDLAGCPAEIEIEVFGIDGCGFASAAQQLALVTDAQAPSLAGVPADAVAECDAVPAPASVTATDGCDPVPALGFEETEIPGGCPGERTLFRTWTATDHCGNAAQAQQVIQVVDTTPPVVTPGSDDLYCLWPPNHRMRCFAAADFAPAIADACSEPSAWRFAGCASSEPEGAGDGNAAPDCVVADDGQSFCVRAERSGLAASGRRYAVSIEATDACGNASAPVVIGHVLVPHDASGGAGCGGK